MSDGLRLLSTSRGMLLPQLHARYGLPPAWRPKVLRSALAGHGNRIEVPRFNPRHFLDVAEMTHAMGIAYDWLDDEWTPEQRKTIRSAMVRMGLKAGTEGL